MAIVPFAAFEPDKSEFSPNSSRSILNVHPAPDGWKPFPAHVAFSDVLPNSAGEAIAQYPIGAFLAQNDIDTFVLYVAGNDGSAEGGFYSLDADGGWTNRSLGGGTPYTSTVGQVWEFAQFGEKVIAVNPNENPQVADVSGGAAAFANLTTTFKAEHIGVVGDFVVMGHLGSNKERFLKWSGVNDHTYWTNGQRGADEQEMPDGGHIQGIIPQQKNAYIIQETKIRRMIFDPNSNFTFRFEVVNPTRGSVSPRGWANIGQDDFVYLSRDGFYRGVDARPIGAERVDTWFYDNVYQSSNALKYRVVARADPGEKIVWWSFPTSSTASKLLGYDWQLDRWCHSDADIRELVQATTGGYNVDSGASVAALGTVDTLPYGPDAQFWKGGTRATFAGFDSANKLGFFDGTAQAATIETERKMLNYPGRAQLSRASVLVDNNNFTVAVSATARPGDGESYGSDLSPEASSPWVGFTGEDGRYHQFKVKIPAGEQWELATGMDAIIGDTSGMY